MSDYTDVVTESHFLELAAKRFAKYAQDDAVAADAQRAPGSSHQQEMAKKTAKADAAILEDGSTDTEAEGLTDAQVDAELTDLEDELDDI